MGYSGRYHAASLAAVLIALAIGILIGIGLADDVVSTASQGLEDSLRSERDAANDRVEELQTEIDTERQFSDAAYPALVGARLQRQRVALIQLGEAPKDTANGAIDAIDAAGGSLASVSSISLPPDVGALIDAAGRRFASARRDPAALERLGEAIGRRLIGGSPLIESLKPDLFTSFSGSLEGVTRVVVIRQPPDDLDAAAQEQNDAFENGLLEGIDGAAEATVGVEVTSTDPTTLGPFSDLGIPTVDHLDIPAGKVAMVYALIGAEGDFGTKDAATSFLPELLRAPAP